MAESFQLRLHFSPPLPLCPHHNFHDCQLLKRAASRTCPFPFQKLVMQGAKAWYLILKMEQLLAILASIFPLRLANTFVMTVLQFLQILLSSFYYWY